VIDEPSIVHVKKPTIGLSAAFLLGASAAAQTIADESTIRAGHSIAVTTCISCHVVSSDQALKPVLGPGIPSFAEIANRPGTTIETLTAAMKVARWHDPGMAPTLLPMSHISDRGRAQVAAYIMSLRTKP
jgi:mono/diheme cytochrome c family protein